MKRILLSMVAVLMLMSCGNNPEQVSALLDRVGGEGTSARIETQVKNLGQKTNILTIGNYNTVLNGLRKLQSLLSFGLVGSELQGKLESEMFSRASDAPVKKINDALKQKAEAAIDELLKQLNL